MKLCYIDESGDTGKIPHASSPVQPVLVIAAVVLDHSQLAAATANFIKLKEHFSPAIATHSRHRLNMILNEMKGNDIRRDVATGSRNVARRAIGFLDKFMDLLEYHRAKIFGRVWIKRLGYPMDSNAVFTSSTQAIFQNFQHHLEHVRDVGLVIADSRSPSSNITVAHAIFTQKFKLTGDSYNRILEMPTFGHSNNHVGLQLADLLVSAMLYPIACQVYCTGHITSTVHVKQEYKKLRNRYGERLKQMQYRFYHNARWKGGITVCDDLGQKKGGLLFGDPASIPLPVSSIISPGSTVVTTSSTSDLTPPPVLPETP